MKITNDVIFKLSKQVKNKKLVTGEYTSDENNENFQYIKSKFFSGESTDKAKLLNVGSGLFTAISQTISYYVGNPSFDLNFPTKRITEDFITLGFACFGLERINGKLQYTYLPADSYYRENGIDYIIRAFVIQSSIGGKKYYFLRTSYNGGIITNELFQSMGGNFTQEMTKVPLDTIDDTANLMETIDTSLEKCFFIVKEDELEESPISEIDKVKNIVYSIDRKIVMFDTQFLQNMESFVLLKGINIPTFLIEKYDESGKLNFSDLGRYLTTEQDGSIEFINNQNSLLQNAIDYERTQTEKISALTSIPLDFLGGTGTSGAIGEGSRELLHGAFIKKIESIRKILDKSIMQSLDIIFKDSGEEYTYSWSDIFSKNTKDLIDEISVALSSGLISRKTALKRYLDYSDDEVDAEILQIQNESTLINNSN